MCAMTAPCQTHKSSTIALWVCRYVLRHGTVREEGRYQIDCLAIAMNTKELKNIGVMEIPPDGSFSLQVLAYGG